MTDEKNEEEKGFKVTDRRFSSQTDEEKKATDAEKATTKTKASEELKKEAPQPEIDFSSFVLSLSTSALIQLGKISDPHTKQPAKNLEAAKQTIDILVIIKEKTKGNLTSQEQAIMDNSLYDLRMMYIEETKK